MILVALFIMFLIPFSFAWKYHEKRKKRNENFYIDYHTKKLEDDRQYKSYLKWCYKKSEVPMNKKEWGEITQKEKQIQNLFK